MLDGPLLVHGFVEQLPAQRGVYISDLLHAILDVPAVKAVRSLVIGPSSTRCRWALDIPAGSVAMLAPIPRSLFRDDLPLRVDPDAVRARPTPARSAPAPAPSSEPGSPVAAARDLVRYRSIQYQLPAAYGIGALGLPSSAPAGRHAQARQLAAYLLIFDQLFANQLAQLAHARELLSPVDGAPRTYFALPVVDVRLDLDALRIADPAAHSPGSIAPSRSAIRASVRSAFSRTCWHATPRSSTTTPGSQQRQPATTSSLPIAVHSCATTRGSAARAAPATTPGATAIRAQSGGYEDRLRRKLGLPDAVRLHVVEHVLLRPLVEDRAQLADEGDPQVPLLAPPPPEQAGDPRMIEHDPWSLHVSVVLQDPALHDQNFEDFVAQTIQTETPAHLAMRLHWLGATDGVDDWAAFETAWSDFRAAYRQYRALLGATAPVLLQLQVRDARDRVIDVLGFGRTYPLRDIPLPTQLTVAPGTRARITLGFSQADSTYQLCDRDSGKPIFDGPNPIIAAGTGAAIDLVTPPITADAAYRVLAVKRDGAQTADRREAWLETPIRVVEGIDTSLVAQILLPVLDTRIDPPAKPTDARIGDYTVAPEIEIPLSQEGVTYELILDAPDLSDPTKHHVVSTAPVVGTSGRIPLHTVPILEDVDLRVRGQKATGDPSNPVIKIGVLDIVMPLRVRANPGVVATLASQVVAFGGASAIDLTTSQVTASYRAYRARVRDRDFVFDATTPTIDVTIDGGAIVRLKRPPQPAVWADLPDFAAVGDAVVGTGGAIELAIGGPATDASFFLLQAAKQHQLGRLGSGSDTLPSAVQLAGALALLVDPNPNPALRFEVALAGGATAGGLLVSGGEPGVFYDMLLDGQTTLIGLPAYFHKHDDDTPVLNKGIEQLRVEIDVVVIRDPATPVLNPQSTPPLPPLIDVAALPADSILHVRARRAMSGLAVDVANTAVLAEVPKLTAPAAVASGSTADITLATSKANERYWLAVGGRRVTDPVAGTGAPLVLSTAAIAARTTFSVVATSIDANTIAVERHTDVTIDVT